MSDQRCDRSSASRLLSNNAMTSAKLWGIGSRAGWMPGAGSSAMARHAFPAIGWNDAVSEGGATAVAGEAADAFETMVAPLPRLPAVVPARPGAPTTER